MGDIELTGALAEVYADDEPVVLDAGGIRVLAFWRPDPHPHWHLITQGLGGTSPGHGELTARIVSPDSTTPPAAITGALGVVLRAFRATGTPTSGTIMNLGALMVPFSRTLRAVWFVADPELTDTADGSDYVQLVGLTADESRAIASGHHEMVGRELLALSPVYATDLARASVVTYGTA